jgi:hypothetical protein
MKKNRYFFAITLYLISIFYLTGCSTTRSNLQEGEILGAPHKMRVKITENKEAYRLEIHPYFSFNRNMTLTANSGEHTQVNSDGVYEVYPVDGEIYFKESGGVNVFDFEGDNIFWRLPSWGGGFDIDFPLSKTFAFTGGFSISEINSEMFLGKNFGIAFMSEKEVWASRFDISLRFQEMKINGSYALIENKTIMANDQTRDVYLFNSSTKDDYANLALGLSFNTRRPEWPLNYFFGFGFGWQSFYTIDDKKIESLQNFSRFNLNDLNYMENYYSINFGIYKNLFDAGRISLGARFTKYTDPNGKLFIPDVFFQYDIIMF